MDDPPKDLYIITTARKRDTMEWEGDLSPFLLSVHEDVNLYSNQIVVDSWNNIKKYEDVKAVSYTHLDVYKRQHWRRSRAILLWRFSMMAICRELKTIPG